MAHKVGDTVTVTRGPHKGDAHKVIHVHKDGRVNVKPHNKMPHQIKYRHGAATAKADEVKKMNKEGTIITPKGFKMKDNDKEKLAKIAKMLKRDKAVAKKSTHPGPNEDEDKPVHIVRSKKGTAQLHRISRNDNKLIRKEDRDSKPISTSKKSGNFLSTKDGAGMTKKGVAAFRAKNPGSKLQTAVTGQVKPGSKDAKRRKSFCAR